LTARHQSESVPAIRRITHLVGAILMEQTDEWAIQRRYMTLETIVTLSDDPDALPAIAAA
jgi:hypothetical protein